MCGIAGFWLRDFRGSYDSSAAHADLVSMAETLAHRGPDDAGVWYEREDGVYLAHRRLSILDLSPAGHQPMVSHSGRFVITFNGEIYNFREMQQELQRAGVPLRSDGDTEVLVNAIELWGIAKTLERSIGMFAFAVWDRKEKEMLLVRDRLGVKPLYYAYQDGCLWFASEPSAIAAHPRFSADLRSSSLSLATRFGYIPAPFSVFEKCWKLPAGCYLRIATSGEAPSEPSVPLFEGVQRGGPVAYWSAVSRARRPNTRRTNYSASLDELDALIADAVRLRLVSDVPLGAFLSGGTDSSLVVSHMRRHHHGRVKTFSIGFDNPTFDESDAAREVAQRFNTDHTELIITATDALSLIPRLPTLFSEPFADSSQIPTFFVAQLARQSVTVSLSGDGGDELFGGYQRYPWANRIWRRFSPVPLFVRRAIAKAMANAPARQLNRLGRIFGMLGIPACDATFGDKVQRAAAMVALQSRAECYEGFISVTRTPHDWLIQDESPEPWHSEWKSWDQSESFTEFMMMIDSLLYLPDDILVKVDRTTMAVGLEGREPLLDHRLYEFAWTLPVAWRGDSNPQKPMIRDLLKRQLPSSLVDRPKKGFSIPLAEWLRGPLREWASDLLSANKLASHGVFKGDAVHQLWQNHLSGRRSPHSLLWNILMIEAWLQNKSVGRSAVGSEGGSRMIARAAAASAY